MRHCYRAILPKGFVRELKNDFEIYFRSPQTIRDSEEMRKELVIKFRIPNTNITIVSAEEFEEVNKFNALPPTQMIFKI